MRDTVRKQVLYVASGSSARVGAICAFLVLISRLAAGQTCQPPGLVAWWQGENNASDVTAAYNGTLVGGVTFAPGVVGSAFKFDPTGYVRAAASPGLIPTDAITVETWVNPAPGQSGWPPIVKKGGVNEPYGYALEMSGGSGMCFWIYIDGLGWQPACASIAPGRWTHVAGVYDGRTLMLYLDGVLAASNAVAGKIKAGDGELRIGFDPQLNRPFTGLIDEPAVFGRALSPDDIQAIVAAGSAGKCGALDPSAPPTMKLPRDITASEGPSGRLVFFDAYAWDPADGRIAATCAPASGTIFPVGQTTVSCAATDSTNLSASGSFKVTVVRVTTTADGLVGHWKFDEASGVTAMDSTDSGQTGALNGVSYTTADGADIPGNVAAALFNGNGIVVIPDSPRLSFGNADPFTIAFWARATVEPGGTGPLMLTKSTCSGDVDNYAVLYGGSPAGVNIYSHVAGFGVVYTLEPGRLTHLTVTYDGAGTARMYFDGRLAGSGPFATQRAPGISLTIGDGPCRDGRGFRGMIDDVRIYNRALADLEVSSLNRSRGLDLDATLAPYSRVATLKAVLRSGDVPVGGKTVAFTLGGTAAGGAVTDARGVATLANVSVAGLELGAHPGVIRATVAADSQISSDTSVSLLTIGLDTPVIAWNPPTLPYGTTSDPSGLNAVANVAGSFVYDWPSDGGSLKLGDQFCVTFTPSDQIHYTATTRCVTVRSLGAAAEKTLRVGSAAVPRVVTGVTVDSMRNLVYAANGIDGTIAVLHGSTNQLVASIPLRSGSVMGLAAFIALDSASNRLYVTDAVNPVLWTIDAATRSVLSATSVPYGGAWSALDFNPTTGLLYLSVPDQGLIAVLDPAVPGQPVALVPVTGLNRHSSFVIDPVTNLVFIGTAGVFADSLSGVEHRVDRIAILGGDRADLGSFNQITSHLTLQPYDLDGPVLAVNPRTQRLYAASRLAADGGTRGTSLSVFDVNPARPSYSQLVSRIELPASVSVSELSTYYGFTYTAAVAVDPITDTIYVKTVASDPWLGGAQVTEIARVDGATATGALIATFDSGEVFPFDGSTFGAMSVNPSTGRLYVSGGNEPAAVSTLVFLGRRQATATVAPSSGATTVETPQASISFTAVPSGGTVTVEQIDPSQLNLQAPGGYSIGDALAYEIATTAIVSAPIRLCFNVSSVNDPASFGALAVLHGENGALVDRTSSRDFSTRTICATVGSLSPFVIARQTGPAYSLQLLFDNTKPVPGGTIPVRVRLVDTAGRNVSSAAVALRADSIERMPGGPSALPNDSGNANPGGLFRFDASLGGYVFNLNTRGLAPGSYQLLIEGPDAPLRYAVTVSIR